MLFELYLWLLLLGSLGYVMVLRYELMNWWIWGED